MAYKQAPTNTIGSAFYQAWLSLGAPSVPSEDKGNVIIDLDTREITATRGAKAHARCEQSPLHYGVDSAPIRAKHSAIGSARWRDKSRKGTELSIHSPRKPACKVSASGAHTWVILDLSHDACRLCGRKANQKPIDPYSLDGGL